ncbi:hypothetical protein RDWZM_003390 [Blomia tropicalis]|uniref:Uncharacterized protein n=1 Tax=Blomia tropicalis TaxID=40697 RepID=A0A9Q0RSM4_BLOTA|nr:hypothetical protein RDWZM_003390 [Blomia tropicalis]
MYYGKVVDWKGGLFWTSYYGFWIYQVVKNGLPGRDVSPETAAYIEAHENPKKVNKVNADPVVDSVVETVTTTIDKLSEEIKSKDDSGITQEAKESAMNLLNTAGKQVEEIRNFIETSKDQSETIKKFTEEFKESVKAEETVILSKVDSVENSSFITDTKATIANVSNNIYQGSERMFNDVRDAVSKFSNDPLVVEQVSKAKETAKVVADDLAKEIPILVDKVAHEAKIQAKVVANEMPGFVDKVVAEANVVANDMKPVVKKVYDEMSVQVPVVVEKVCKEAQIVASNIAKDLPDIAHQATKIPEKIKDLVSNSSPSANISNVSLPDNIKTTENGVSPFNWIPKSFVPDIKWKPSFDWFNNALKPDQSGSTAGWDSSSWPHCTGLKEWSSNSQKK